jgi:hypothetical protein
MVYQTIKVRKLNPVIGAEIFGLDLSRDLGNQQFQEVHDALMENLVIFFRDQTMTVEQHKAFGRRFGKLHVHPNAPQELAGHPEILVIKADETTKHVAGEDWHSDVSCDEEPPLGSILHMHRVPPDGGGDTMFSNMYAAFEALSPPLQQMLEGMTAIHDSAKEHRYRAKNADRNDMAFPRSVHPWCERIRSPTKGSIRQSGLHDPNHSAQAARERRDVADVVSSLRDTGVHMPVPLAAEFGRVLGQSLHSASRLVRLFPASPLWPASHSPGRQTVL